MISLEMRCRHPLLMLCRGNLKRMEGKESRAATEITVSRLTEPTPNLRAWVTTSAAGGYSTTLDIPFQGSKVVTGV